MSVITRFAPSPTGFLHIGGARTALFNYLYAKHMGGKFLLRIEDTDKERSTKEAVEAIIDGLKWLGLNWDDELVMQSNNLEEHKKIALNLVKSKKAYYCYCRPKKEDNINTFKENIKCKCINKINIDHTIKPSIRLLINKEGSTVLNDLVMGEITVNHSEIDDFIILRNDGTPTYLLAVVIDDINMKITHVIRGDDHLTNTFRQIQIYNALSTKIPMYAHIPLIYGEDGTKMSKRHGALGTHEYKNFGYLSESLINYLLHLGWSHGNDEFISLKDAIKWFDIKDVNKSPSRFNFNKLNSVNFHYIKSLDLPTLFNLVLPFVNNMIDKNNILVNYIDNLKSILVFLQNRFKTLYDIAKNSIFILEKNIEISNDGISVIIKNKNILYKAKELIENIDDFSRENLNNIFKKYSEENNISLGNFVQPIRIALCGKKESPASVFDIMTIINKENTIYRLENAVNFITN